MDRRSCSFTLIELIVVVIILSILGAIAVPVLGGFISQAEEAVCHANLKTIERAYAAFLVENDIDHEDSVFDRFIIENFDEVCPSGGGSLVMRMEK